MLIFHLIKVCLEFNKREREDLRHNYVAVCVLTHPHSLHLGAEGIQQLKQDQTQRVYVYFVRVRVSRELL